MPKADIHRFSFQMIFFKKIHNEEEGITLIGKRGASSLITCPLSFRNFLLNFAVSNFRQAKSDFISHEFQDYNRMFRDSSSLGHTNFNDFVLGVRTLMWHMF